MNNQEIYGWLERIAVALERGADIADAQEQRALARYADEQQRLNDAEQYGARQEALLTQMAENQQKHLQDYNRHEAEASERAEKHRQACEEVHRRLEARYLGEMEESIQ